MYYRLLEDFDNFCGVLNDPEIMYEIDFVRGQVIGDEDIKRIDNPLVFQVDCTRDRPPMHLDGISIPVMSKELVALFQKHGVDNLQLFPALLKNEKTGDTWTDFYAVNIVGLIACADMDASDHSVIGRRPGSDFPLAHFHRLVIDEKKAHGHYLFRLAEEPHVILINDEIDQALCNNKPRGGQWGIDVLMLEHVN